ncbi:SGNH/GDSL hydrolase family protein [Amycolatopsis sp. lyj-112]|uniref:SGNH/GDSL hydrolase family protein n=1 Tax=Amycolatopsis sp. lyj-112 TaxID=2789288 RepID=UPI003978C449
MTTIRSLALGLAGLALATAACSTPPATDTPVAAAGADQRKVLFLGDSIAEGEALPLAAAFKAGGAGFTSLASAGGGNVVGPFSDENWKKLPEQITSAAPTVVVYQIATYDWGTRQEQQAAYEKLLKTVTGAGAKLVFVTMPPIKPDDFYQPHMADLERTPDVARAVAAASPDKAVVLDSAEVWTGTYQQTRDGKADRSADGIHTCPQGAARFTGWLLTSLAKVLPGFTPPAPETWANTGWSGDKHFQGC